MEEHMVKIKQNLKAALDKQKSYADKEKAVKKFKSVGSCVFESQTKEDFSEIRKLSKACNPILWAI